jgi:hypothetical protein
MNYFPLKDTPLPGFPVEKVKKKKEGRRDISSLPTHSSPEKGFQIINFKIPSCKKNLGRTIKGPYFSFLQLFLLFHFSP